MSRLVKIVNNKYVQIEEYKNPNICFNTNEYDNFEDYCTLRETFDPFEIFYENQELKKQLHEASLTIQEMTEQDIECPSNCEKLKILKEQLEEYKRLGFKYLQDKNNDLETQQKEFIKYLENEKDRLARICNNLGEDKFDEADDILQKYKEIIGGKCES